MAEDFRVANAELAVLRGFRPGRFTRFLPFSVESFAGDDLVA
jgi:hypothetical protein